MAELEHIDPSEQNNARAHGLSRNDGEASDPTADNRNGDEPEPTFDDSFLSDDDEDDDDYRSYDDEEYRSDDDEIVSSGYSIEDVEDHLEDEGESDSLDDFVFPGDFRETSDEEGE